jgi:hypothetical protein
MHLGFQKSAFLAALTRQTLVLTCLVECTGRYEQVNSGARELTAM